MRDYFKKVSETEFEGKKTFEFTDMKLESNDSGDTFISGYVNTKNTADSYGDIPTNYQGKPVYDLSKYVKNPVLLLDHVNSGANVVGRAVEFYEDEIGLFVKFLLMKNPVNEDVAHAINAVKEGLLKGFSIGGRWAFEDQQNPAHLTRALISEISVVAIGADSNSLITNVGSKMSGEYEDKKVAAIAALVSAYSADKSKNFIQAIERII